MAESPIRLSRKELYQKVWSEPMSRLAPTLGLSDRGLANLCKRHRIPRPGRGYWQKKKFGKQVRRTPLPKLRKDEEALATITIHKVSAPKSSDEPPGPVEKQRAFEKRPENRIEVPERVGRYHPLVRQSRDILKGWGSPRYGWNNQYRSLPADCLDIRVERASRRRALKIMDTVIKAFEKRCFPVRISKANEDPKTIITVGEVELPIEIEEKYERIELPPTESDLRSKRLYGWEPHKRYDYEGTGNLALRINPGRWISLGVRKTWADGKTQRVEELLNQFVVGLVRVAEAKKQRDRERKEERKRREEKRRLAEMRRRRLREEQERREELKRQASVWAEHGRMREYVSALRKEAEREGPLPAYSPLRLWIEWAQSYLEKTDPLRQPRDLAPGATKKELHLPDRRKSL